MGWRDNDLPESDQGLPTSFGTGLFPSEPHQNNSEVVEKDNLIFRLYRLGLYFYTGFHLFIIPVVRIPVVFPVYDLIVGFIVFQVLFLLNGTVRLVSLYRLNRRAYVYMIFSAFVDFSLCIGISVYVLISSWGGISRIDNLLWIGDYFLNKYLGLCILTTSYLFLVSPVWCYSSVSGKPDRSRDKKLAIYMAMYLSILLVFFIIIHFIKEEALVRS
jgi:hypothetical protein